MLMKAQPHARAGTNQSHSPAPTGFLQRKCACRGSSSVHGTCPACREEMNRPREAMGESRQESVPPIVNEALQSPGQPLDSATRAVMEPRFGHDFSRVRVHLNARAAESARAVGALAYTAGHDIVFGDQQYAPDSPEGRRLIAHELTHVVQQGAGVLSASSQSHNPSSVEAPEKQAEENARRIMRGEVSTAIQPNLSPHMQRQEEGAPAPSEPSRAPELEGKHFDTKANIEDLAGILWHETRGKHPHEAVAIGWIAINRLLILNTTKVSSLIGGNQFASLAGAPLMMKLQAQMLLSGQYEDPTNGSFFYVAPQIMPDRANRGCCDKQPGPCNTKRFQSGVDCAGGLQEVPGTDPPQERFFPSFATADKRQPQPDGTDPMQIQVYRK